MKNLLHGTKLSKKKNKKEEDRKPFVRPSGSNLAKRKKSETRVWNFRRGQTQKKRIMLILEEGGRRKMRIEYCSWVGQSH